MTIPNIITVARLLCVPAVVYALLLGEMDLALILFVAAGLSDGIDGFIARHYNQRSRLGAYLDPMADKLLLVSVFVMLGFLGELPLWLIVAVVTRDVLIVAAIIVSSLLHHPVEVRPIFVSKANTAFQVILAVVVLAELTFATAFGPSRGLLIVVVAALTAVSAAAYLMDWMKHMSVMQDDE